MLVTLGVPLTTEVMEVLVEVYWLVVVLVVVVVVTLLTVVVVGAPWTVVLVPGLLTTLLTDWYAQS